MEHISSLLFRFKGVLLEGKGKNMLKSSNSSTGELDLMSGESILNSMGKR